MKTFFNILVILVVAVLVGGMFYGAVTAFSAGTNQTSLQERSAPDGGLARPEGEDRDGGTQFPVEMIKSLVMMSVVAVAYLNISKYFSKKKMTTPAVL